MLRRLCKQLLLGPRQPALWLSQCRVDRCWCSDDANKHYKKNKTQAFDYHEVVENVKDMENREGQEFLDNMDELMVRRKQRFEDEIEKMKGIYLIPQEPLSPHQWKILLTECKSEQRRKTYLEFLTRKEFKASNDKRPRHRNVLVNTHRVLNDFTYPIQRRDRLFQNYGSYAALMYGRPLIFDCDLEMSYREQVNSELQLLNCYGVNLRHRNPFHIHYTGYKNTRFAKSIKSMNLDERMFASFYEGSFMDLFRPEDLIYLTPDGPPLTKFDPHKIPIIGSSVDLNPKPRLTLGKARSLGIQVGRFPLEENVRLFSNRSLTLNNSISIMLNVSISHDWRDAIIKSLPPTQFEAKSEAERHKSRMSHRMKIDYKA